MLLFKKKDLLIVISKSDTTVQFTKPLKDILKYQYRYNYKFKMYENGKVTVANDYIIEPETLTVLFDYGTISYTPSGATYTENSGDSGDETIELRTQTYDVYYTNRSGVDVEAETLVNTTPAYIIDSNGATISIDDFKNYKSGKMFSIIGEVVPSINTPDSEQIEIFNFNFSDDMFGMLTFKTHKKYIMNSTYVILRVRFLVW